MCELNSHKREGRVIRLTDYNSTLSERLESSSMKLTWKHMHMTGFTGWICDREG